MMIKEKPFVDGLASRMCGGLVVPLRKDRES